MMFSPSYMNRLSYTKKFLLLGLMSLVAIVVVVYSLYISLERVIRTSQRELEGIALIEPFSQTIQLIQQHRVLSAVLLGGDKTLQDSRAIKEREATEAFKAFEEKLAASLASDKDLQRVRENWERIRTEGLNWTMDENFVAHTRLIDQMLLFEVVAADEYALTIDPEVATYYLITNTIQQLPNALESISRIRAYGINILAKKQVTAQQKVEMNILIAELDDAINKLKVNLDKVVRYNPALRDSISAVSNNIADSARRTINLVESNIIAGHFTTRPGDFFGRATVSIDKDYAQLYGSLLPACESLIKARIARAENTLRVSVGIASLLFLVLIYFSVSIGYAITRNIKSLNRSARVIIDGDYTAQANVEGTDEISELAASFNAMTRFLRQDRETMRAVDWLKSGQNELNSLMRGEQETSEMANKVLAYLVEHLKASVGVLYLFDDHSMELYLSATYAYTPRKNTKERFRLGESLIGQAAREQKIINITSVPPDYLTIGSALGESMPKVISLIPLMHGKRLVGAIEMGSFGEFGGIELEFLELAREGIAIGLEMSIARHSMAELLVETQQQSEELRVQQEELQQSNEELEERAQILEQQREKIRISNQQAEAANEKLQQKAEELSRVSNYKSEFMANMSHELRTPLNSLMILSNLLAQNREGNLTDKQVEYAATIHGAGKDLLNLISDILDLSKVEAGQMQLHFTDLPVRGLCDSLNALFTPMAKEKELTLQIDVDADVPGIFRGDEQRVQQILKNLLSNALKFTAKGDVTVRVFAPTGRENPLPEPAIAFVVSDTGIGIPADKQQLIFQAFQQADGSINRKYGGTGLGLSISLQLARAMHGDIRMSSVVGEGSVFTMYLPLAGAGVGINEQAETRSAAVSIATNILLPVQGEKSMCFSAPLPDDREQLTTGDKSILIIEDDLDFVRVLQEMIRKRGFPVLVASNGESGIALADHFVPSAIVLDVMLPHIDGWRVIHSLKDNPRTRHIPVHFITCLEDRQKALSMGAIGFITKPVSMEQLNNVLLTIEGSLAKSVKQLLIVEDNAAEAKSMVALLENEGVEITIAVSGKEAIRLLSSGAFDCMVLDLALSDMSGFELLEHIAAMEGVRRIPVIIHSGRELSQEDERRLRRYAESIIIKGTRSPERLLNEVTLFLHLVESSLHPDKQRMIRTAIDKEAMLEGRKVLLVDDDMRNIFSISSILAEKNMQVIEAENGVEALAKLDEHPDMAIVLMDIMMPEMDGYTAMRAIRNKPRFAELPIIAMTAKALKGDHEKCIEAGASDYIAKPIEMEKLFSLIRVWTFQQTRGA